jgi:hypothetical protein
MRKKGNNMQNFDELAKNLVRQYAENHLDKSDGEIKFDVYIVWKCKILQNWKYLLSTSLFDGMYYELTFNGNKQEWYFDAYKKFENVCIEQTQIGEEFYGK